LKPAALRSLKGPLKKFALSSLFSTGSIETPYLMASKGYMFDGQSPAPFSSLLIIIKIEEIEEITNKLNVIVKWDYIPNR
jgi:hypothetical protein